MSQRNKKFLARYFHDGSWWGVELYADDLDDAQVICDAHNLQLDGQYVISIPASVGR